MKINHSLTFLLFTFLCTPIPSSADEITMKLSSTCGFDTSDLQVEIWNPPGGYAKVASDRSVKVNVPAGHKLIPMVAPSYCENNKNCVTSCRDSGQQDCSMPNCIESCTEMNSRKLSGPWTEAKDGGKLKVMCQ